MERDYIQPGGGRRPAVLPIYTTLMQPGPTPPDPAPSDSATHPASPSRHPAPPSQRGSLCLVPSQQDSTSTGSRWSLNKQLSLFPVLLGEAASGSASCATQRGSLRKGVRICCVHTCTRAHAHMYTHVHTRAHAQELGLLGAPFCSPGGKIDGERRSPLRPVGCGVNKSATIAGRHLGKTFREPRKGQIPSCANTGPQPGRVSAGRSPGQPGIAGGGALWVELLVSGTFYC